MLFLSHRRGVEAPTRQSAQLPENLHIAGIQRIVGKHRNNLRMPLENVRYWINRALGDNGGTAESKDLQRMRSSNKRLACRSPSWPKSRGAGQHEQVDRVLA